MILNLENLKEISWGISGIYKIQNIYSGRIYIGQSKDIRKRLREHLECCKSSNVSENKGLVNSWNKYGEDCFDFEILKECSCDLLDDEERYWISYYDSFKNGYNMTSGGQNGSTIVTWTDEQRKHFSDVRNPKAVLKIDLEGNVVERYWSVPQAAKMNNLDSRGIHSCCNKGISKTVGGFIWIYEEDYNTFDLEYYLDRKKKKPIEQYDIDGNFIKLWNHGCEFEGTEFGRETINSCCNHNSLSAYGYIWKFQDDNTRIINKEYCEEAKRKLDSVKVNKIYQLDKQQNVINIFNSTRETEYNGFSRRLVRECCKHIKDTYKGFIWMYENEYLEMQQI